MARRRARRRARSRATTANGSTNDLRATGVGLDASVVPRVLLGAVDGVGIVAVGALELARDVLMSAVSGAANVGAEALMAAVAGTRGVVSATSRTVADVAGAAQGTLLATIDNVRHPRRGSARLSTRRAAAPTSEEPATSISSDARSPARTRTRGPRLVTRPARPSVAA